MGGPVQHASFLPWGGVSDGPAQVLAEVTRSEHHVERGRTRRPGPWEVRGISYAGCGEPGSLVGTGARWVDPGGGSAGRVRWSVLIGQGGSPAWGSCSPS